MTSCWFCATGPRGCTSRTPEHSSIPITQKEQIMKSNHSVALIAALSLSVASASFAQSPSQGMGDMPMKSKGKSDCMGMEGMKGKEMGGMDMKDMDQQKCMD